MGRRKSSSTTESTTTTSGSMGGGMDGGGMGDACYVYPIRPAEVPALDPNPDVVYNRGIDMNIPMTMDDGNTVNMWGFSDTADGGGMREVIPLPGLRRGTACEHWTISKRPNSPMPHRNCAASTIPVRR